MPHGGTSMIASSEAPPVTPGMVLEGAYRLVRLIGRGGMSVVFEGVQLRLNKRVAIKVMPLSAMADKVALARFRREAEITSKLGHPHLVHVSDFGTAESGQPYLVMEYLEGEDLDQRLQRTPRLPLPTVARIVVQTASALGAAHAQNVVHRDLKPANIFLLQIPGEPDFVKVLDFGISKIKTGHTRRLTGVHTTVGTPSYMSPEQITGRHDDIDHRADQWALACITWEMLCGHPPFVADDMTAMFYQITRIDPPSLAKEVPELPPEAEAILRRALSRQHVDRYPSIREFAHSFASALLGQPIDATPAPIVLGTPPLIAPVHRDSSNTMRIRRMGLRLPILLGAGLLVFGLVAFWGLRPHSTGPSEPTGRSVVAPPPEIIPLPAMTPSPVAPTQTSTGSPDSTLPQATHPPDAKPAKPQVSKAPGIRDRTKAEAKKWVSEPKGKHRLFEEL